MFENEVQSLALKKKAHENDKDLSVVFFMDAVEDVAASKDAGRPIFKDVPFIRILVPGDATNIFITEAWTDERNADSHARRFPEQWAAFKRGQSTETPKGTPLDKLPGIVKSQVLELKHFHIQTVEQLANLSDGNAQKFMGGLDLRQRAQDWLATANGAAPLAQARAELAQRDADMAAMREQMRDMQAQMATLAAAQETKRGPGRPPKNADT